MKLSSIRRPLVGALVICSVVACSGSATTSAGSAGTTGGAGATGSAGLASAGV
ncbi:MAG: hypothetical protein JWM82_397, partial [Myxococcales bacterium]|nr:hypothetical protein [Myxococcales bacterium]